MTVTSSSRPSRLACAFRVLFDGRFAARVAELAAEASEPQALPSPSAPPSAAAAPALVSPGLASEPSASTGALQLLALLQREGRFVDFVQQDIAGFGDADIGAAARLVHEGCRKALRAHARVVSVRSEAEGSSVVLQEATSDVKLVGNVAGSAPFRGVLRHKGWRVDELTLPTLLGSHDPKLVAAAELELS